MELQEVTKQLVDNNRQALELENKITEQVAAFQDKLKALKEQESVIKESIKQAMVNNKINKYDDEFIAVTYVAPTVRKSLDTTKLKSEQPEIYEKKVMLRIA
jgi:predicted phage-related endonuclease